MKKSKNQNFRKSKIRNEKGAFGVQEGQKGYEEGAVFIIRLLVRVFVVADTTIFFMNILTEYEEGSYYVVRVENYSLVSS